MKQAAYCSKCCTLNIINLFQEFIIPSTGEKGQRRCRVQVYGRWRRRREGEWRRSATQQAHHVQTWAGGLAMSSTSWNGECDVGWRIEDQWRWWAGQRLLQILHMNYEIDDDDLYRFPHCLPTLVWRSCCQGSLPRPWSTTPWASPADIQPSQERSSVPLWSRGILASFHIWLHLSIQNIPWVGEGWSLIFVDFNSFWYITFPNIGYGVSVR